MLATSQDSGCSSCTERGTISYTYDNQGHALSRTDENGHTLEWVLQGGTIKNLDTPTMRHGMHNGVASKTCGRVGTTSVQFERVVAPRGSA